MYKRFFYCSVLAILSCLYTWLMKGLANLLPMVGIFLCLSVFGKEDTIQPSLHDMTTTALSTYLSDPDSAIAITHQAITLARLNDDFYYEGLCYFVLTKAYWVKANYRLSTEYGFKALRIFENTQYTQQHVDSKLALARTLVELGSYSAARTHLLQILAIANKKNDTRIRAQFFREYSYLLTETDQLDSALYYSDEGIKIFEKTGDSVDVSVLYGRKSRIFFTQGKFEQSRRFAFRAMLLDTLTGNKRGLGISYYLAAQNERAMKNLPNAERLFKHSIRINKDIGNLMWLVRSHDRLAELYVQINQPALAAEQFRLVSEYKDSLYNAEKSGQIQEMQSLYELEGKESRIKLLQKENELNHQEVKNQQLMLAFSVVGILLLVVVIFFMTRLRYIQNRTNRDLEAKNIAIEKQKEEMQSQAENLQQLNELKTKLFSAISHDLRGPISNVQALLDLFTKKLMTADEFLLISDKLKANLNSTQRILENLLNWAVSQMEGIKTEKQNVDLGNCIDDAARLMEEIANRKNIIIRKKVEENLVVRADADQLQLILRNLIHNGIKFSKSGSELAITAYRENKNCRTKIRDSGIGMSQEEIDRIINSKEHFTKVGTHQEKGTGLGLLLCQEFIAKNGGIFEIKSKSGEWTEVSFTLALANNL
jgi:two-component system, sensor histidine kinase and response regulator